MEWDLEMRKVFEESGTVADGTERNSFSFLNSPLNKAPEASGFSWKIGRSYVVAKCL
jgi:hypothetical protein